MLTDEAVVEGLVVCATAHPYGSILLLAIPEGKALSVFLSGESLPDPQSRVGQHITIVYDRVTGLVLQVIY